MVPVYSNTASTLPIYSSTNSTAGTYSTNEVYLTACPYRDDYELEFDEPRPAWPLVLVPRLKTCILPPKQMTRVSMTAWVRGRAPRVMSNRTLRRLGTDLRR
jgi:hypothetical protein